MAEVTDVDIVSGAPTGGTGTVPTLSKTNTVIGSVTETAPASDTASSGLNGRLQRIAQRVTSLIALLPTSIGAKTAANSLAVTTATDDATIALYGGVTETAPASDTASSGLNGRLQRIAQRLTSLLPANLTVKAASTAPVAADPALVVAVSPNGQNANLNVDPNSGVAGHFGAPVAPLDYYSQYETVAASQSDQVMGATGAQYDYIAGVLIVPANTSPGAVSVKDGNGSAITVFTGGASSVTDLKPFVVPLGLYALAATTGGWKITTGSNVSAIGIGKFT